MDPIRILRSRTVVMATTNIDTDQIIPARFLTTTTKEGLGAQLFADWRYDASGAQKLDFVLNTPAAQGCQVLVAGRNIGCGSSREHAPWALVDFGFRAVISTEIADIFRNNSLKNGLLPVIVDAATHEWLLANPGAEVTLDLESRELGLPDGRKVTFPVEAFARFCLLNGTDEMGYLLGQGEAIGAYESRHGKQPTRAKA
jgi:3-isopropylmalate/(R)-2-methylmalate dehydratase small subunit